MAVLVLVNDCGFDTAVDSVEGASSRKIQARSHRCLSIAVESDLDSAFPEAH